jgi:formylglycine-generating enzyme required for sulfatase activity
MGSPDGEPGRFDGEETQHRVTITRAFEFCDRHVTQAEWESVMGWNSSRFTGDGALPVENITWFDAIAYCNARSIREHRSPVYAVTDTVRDGAHVTSAVVTWDRAADGYRLPTEAEWEYACRAGSVTAYYNGPLTAPDPARCTEDRGLDAISWYCANSGHRTHVAGGKHANAWGLYDMAGNVQQWCWDWFREFDSAATQDPAGPETGATRVWRGGGWDYDPRHCRSADRGRDGPEGHFDEVGVRLARGAR